MEETHLGLRSISIFVGHQAAQALLTVLANDVRGAIEMEHRVEVGTDSVVAIVILVVVQIQENIGQTSFFADNLGQHNGRIIKSPTMKPWEAMKKIK